MALLKRARFLAIGLLVGAGGFGLVALAAGPAAAQKALPAASFTMDRSVAYLGDPSETFTFTFTNTGSEPIVEISLNMTFAGPVLPPPFGSAPVTVTGCPSPPSGWSASVTTTRCRWTTGAGNALLGGQSRDFPVTVSTAPGTRDRNVTFKATLNTNDANATPTAGRVLDIHAWEITQVAVNTGAPAAVGGECPAPRTQAPRNVPIGMVVCGINHTTGTATPSSATLGGTFINTSGTWSSGPVAPTATPRVLGNWAGTVPTTANGTHTVVARVFSSTATPTFASSPATTFGGYITNQPPVAVDDGPYASNEDGFVSVVAPGILGNDSDADGDPLTVAAPLVDQPDNGMVTVSPDGSFVYTPNGNFFGSDSFTYQATDGAGLSNPATVTITVNPVNDAPSDITVSPNTVAENEAVGTDVGTLSTLDVDLPGDSHVYTLVSGDGDADNASFQINGSVLETNAVFNFEADSSYSVRVRSTDAANATVEKALTITITNVNEEPTNLTLSNNFINENQPAGTVVGTITATDPDAGDTHTWTMAAGPGDDDNASFTMVGNVLQTTEPLAVGAYSIRVRGTDAGGLFREESGTINVLDVPEPPTDIALDDNAVDENQPVSTVVGTLSSSDPDAGNTFTYTLVAGTGDADNASFQISGNALQTNAVFDHEADDSYSIRIRVTDNNSLWYEESFTITITDANDAPTDLALSPSSVAENQPVNTLVGSLTATDPDAGDTHTFTLVAGTGDDDNAAFQISGDELLTNAVFDFEADSSYSVRVQADDGNGGTVQKQLTVTITDANDAPVAVDDSFGAATGSVSPPAPGVLDNDTDPDGGALTAVLVTGPSHTSGAGGSFTFNADGSFSYTRETGSSATSDSFTYKALDPTTAESNVATVTIAFNQPPVAVDDAATTAEDTPVSIDVSANDTDAETANPGLTAVMVGSAVNGTAELQADNRTVIFTPAADFDGAGTFTYKAFDGTSQSTNTATVTITVTGANDAPVLSNLEMAPVAYTEQTAPVPLTSAIVVADVDDTNLESAVVDISAGRQTGDELVFTDQNGIAGSFNSGTGVLTLSGTSTVASYQTALRSITFRNLTNDDPSTSRTVRFEVNDGDIDSNLPTRNITITPVNDRPVVTLDAGSVAYTENDPPIAISPGLTIVDVDDADLTFLQVDLSASGFVVGEDELSYTGSLPPSVTFSGVHPDGIIQFVGSATVAEYEALARTVSYRTLDDTPPLARTAVFRVGDGTITSLDVSRVIDITAVNDVPAIADASAASSYNEQDPTAALVSPDLNITDPDDLNINSATLTLASPVAGDELTFASPQNGISGTYVPGTGVLALTGTTTLANYQTAIRSVGFRNSTSDNPGTSRSVAIKVNDGDIDSNTINRTVTVVAVNDPPVNTVPATQTGTEDVAKTLTFSVADPDATTVRVALTAANGTVTLASTAGLTINSGANGSGAVTFTGAKAAVNTAMSGMSFLGTPNYHEGHAFDSNLSIVTSDEGQSGSGGTLTDTDAVTINLAAVNDAPVAVAKAVTVQANMGLNDQGGLLVGVTDPDSGDPGYVAGHTLAGVNPSGCAGCTITDIQAAGGSFDLDVGAGLLGAHTLQYTVTDNGSPVGPAATSAPATINLTVSGPVIWFVQATAAPGGDGTMSSPFRTIADADAVDATGHRIFLFSASYNDDITLNTDERLIGQGVTQGSCAGSACFDTVLGITPPSNTPARPAVNGTRPIIANTITIGGNNGHVRGVNLTATNVQGIAATGRTGINIGEVSITANNAAAVNFSNSAGTASFTEIDATGGSSGIIWTNASAQNGALTITGTGTADCTSAANCTGGAIQNTTGAGVLVSNLNATTSLSLTNVFVQGTGNEGVNAAGVNGVAFTNVRFHDAGNAAGESGIELNDVTGTGTLTGSVLTQSSENNLYINNSAGSLTFTADGNTISDTTLDAAGNDGISVLGLSSANVTLNVTDSTFSNNDGDHVQVATDSSSTGNYAATIDDNSFTTTNANVLGGGLTMGGGGSGTFDLDIRDNTITGAIVGSFTVGFLQANGAAMNVTIDNNDIGNAATVGSGGSFGIEVEGNTQSTINTLITNNRVRNWNNPAGGIRVLASDTCGVHVPPPPCQPGGTVNATVTGNTVANPGPFATHGMLIQSGATANDTNVLCADVGGAGALANNVEGNEGNGGADIRVFQRFGTTMRLRGYAGGATDTAAVGSYLNGRNTITTNSVGTPGGTGYLNTSPAGAACPLP